MRKKLEPKKRQQKTKTKQNTMNEITTSLVMFESHAFSYYYHYYHKLSVKTFLMVYMFFLIYLVVQKVTKYFISK